MALAHFNAVAGRDEWRDVRGLIVLGRPMPPPAAVERIAGVLTGRAVETTVKGWYPVEAVTLRGADGSVRTVEADRHPDALTEAVRASICDAELGQAIGRGRGVGRSAAAPLDVLICGNVPLPVPVETVADWQPPTFDETLLADHGAVPSSQGDAARLARMTPNAVKIARRLGCASNDKYSIGAHPNLCRVAYQIAGPGRARATLAFDPRRIPDVAGWLAAKLGPVAYLGPVEAPADADAPTVEAFAPVETVEAAAPPIMRDALGLPMRLDDGADDLAAMLADWQGGKLPAALLPAIRDAVRASGQRQEDFAARVGISRPQIANALQGRFGLSADVAARFRAVVGALLSHPSAQSAFL
jgi:putative DNA primase/helicase